MDQTGLQPAGGVPALADTVAANSTVQDSVEQMLTNTIQVSQNNIKFKLLDSFWDRIIYQLYYFRIAARTEIIFLKTSFPQSISL